VHSIRFALIPAIAGFVAISIADHVAVAGERGPQPIAVLDLQDDRPVMMRPTNDAVQRAFEDALSKEQRFRVVAKKPGQNAVCTDDDCRVKFGRELRVERVLETRIEPGSGGQCLVHASILSTATGLPEITANRTTACDQTSVLAAVQHELGPALRKEPTVALTAAPAKPKPVPLTDKRIVGNWDIKHIGAKHGRAPNLTGAQLKFAADGKYRGEGEVHIDSDEHPGYLSIGGAYGFNGRVLSIRNWGTEFEHCEVMTKKPAELTPKGVNESEFSKQATCKLYFETPDKIWVWYPGIEGVILDTWTRASRASK
jgi:hypothetical protein